MTSATSNQKINISDCCQQDDHHRLQCNQCNLYIKGIKQLRYGIGSSFIHPLHRLLHRRFFLALLILLVIVGLASTININNYVLPSTQYVLFLARVQTSVAAITFGSSSNSSNHNNIPVLDLHPHQKQQQNIQQEVVVPVRRRRPANGPLIIQDVVLLPDDLLLIIPLNPTENSESEQQLVLPPKQTLACSFGSQSNATRPVVGIDYLDNRALVRCQIPSDTSLLPEVALTETRYKGKRHAARRRTVAARQTGSQKITSDVKKWDWLVFESQITSGDVVLFAKGINRRQGKNVSPSELSCVFGAEDDGLRGVVAVTKVTESAQEVFRCHHPRSLRKRREAVGRRVSLRWNNITLPTVVFYDLPAATRVANDGEPRADSDVICSCTMVYNVAKFVREWALYHRAVGVDQFIIYDNNSDDGIDEEIDWLAGRQVSFSRYPWPWPKTQEAGLSHCVAAQTGRCDWVLFSDVDEFLFPSPSWYWPATAKSNVSVTPFRQLLTSARGLQKRLTGSSTPIGQLSFTCRDFGPSGLSSHPAAGVTQGYTCRTRVEERHKSAVKLSAVSHQLLNAVHHFELQPGYATFRMPTSAAVVNHYKFQAWPEFRQKFRRRVSAYVADWKERRNVGSRDRTPGLGFRDSKPADWERRFCEVSDTALRDFSSRFFAVNSTGNLLQWQL